MSEYTLWCIIADSWRPFPVKIDGTETARALKAAIKDKELLACDVDALVLYQINVRFTMDRQHLEKVYDICQDLGKRESLKPWGKLSNLFGSMELAEVALQILIIEHQAGLSINLSVCGAIPDHAESPKKGIWIRCFFFSSAASMSRLISSPHARIPSGSFGMKLKRALWSWFTAHHARGNPP
jgi:hypothetical protein